MIDIEPTMRVTRKDAEFARLRRYLELRAIRFHTLGECWRLALLAYPIPESAQEETIA